MMELRMAKVEKLIQEAEEWDSEEDDISKLILILEEAVSILCKINNRTLDVLLDEVVKNIKSASAYSDKVKEIKKSMKKMNLRPFIICDKDGFCISSMEIYPLDAAGNNELINVEYIDDLLEYKRSSKR